MIEPSPATELRIDLYPDEKILTMSEHDLRLYVMTSQRVFRLDDDKLVQVPFVNACK